MAAYNECSGEAFASAVSKFSDFSDPALTTFVAMLGISTMCFVVSTISGNASQVDKIWSMTPVLYSWMALDASSSRSLLMAVLATVWGVRLTWNFNRRGGYEWPPWKGEEDYRWPALRQGIIPGFTTLDRPIPWMIFNLTFISFYQNALLWLTAAPSLVVWAAANSDKCSGAKDLNWLDYVAAALMLTFITIESVADNQQYAFQTEKYRKKDAGEPLEGDMADGFNQSGLYAIVRKPNYASEQSIWVCYYFFGVAATGNILNWSVLGCLLLIALFQGSGWMTELITLKKYPKYAIYMQRVGQYLPFKFIWNKVRGEEAKRD
ncbi:hypothetical protein TrVE_jg6754 [Triparma verrucosa]|uniref:Steroid 5-alpha reductase C-terminal domain-containing protein n=1 Tax=Triparma verrucosa TaxID=1606542 RepID=A0A9W7FJY0_9STRA|nr:hypothetical protein TrVE_jg6754 [Triparma verrucosa]